jgi:hypothetical protein
MSDRSRKPQKRDEKNARAPRAKAPARRAIGLTLSPRELRDLAILVAIGEDVTRLVAEAYGERDAKPFARAASALLAAAAEALGEPTQKAATEEFLDERDKILDEYDNDAFWFEIERRLAERDLARAATPADRAYVRQNHGELPPKAEGFAERWRAEFDAHGVDRIVIDAAAPPVPALDEEPKENPKAALAVKKVFTALVVSRYIRARRKKLGDLSAGERKLVAELASTHFEVVPEPILRALEAGATTAAAMRALQPYLPRFDRPQR